MHRDGPMVGSAGAGSGKTKIITSRIAHPIRTAVWPWEILAVTFTNKAANEMKARVLTLCPQGYSCLISTFHSACARWLREFATDLGFTSDFTIYDDDDSSAALKVIMKDMVKNVELPNPSLCADQKLHSPRQNQCLVSVRRRARSKPDFCASAARLLDDL